MCHLTAGSQNHLHRLDSEPGPVPSYTCAICDAPIFKGVMVGEHRDKFCEDHGTLFEYSKWFLLILPDLTIGELMDLEHTEIHFVDNGVTISTGKNGKGYFKTA